MPGVAQQNRSLKITTPLGADKLLLTSFQGTDALSGLFHYQVEMLGLADAPVAFDKLLGQSVTIEVTEEKTTGAFNGILSRLSQAGIVQGINENYILYRGEVVPKLWFLTCSSHSRIFTEQTVVDIVKKVLAEGGVTAEWKLTGSYPKRDYCVQYQETDFAFISRLLEEEGIYYFFQHAAGSHTMVLGNAPDKHPALGTSLTFRSEDQALGTGNSVVTWEKTQEIRPGKVTLRDHHFQKTGTTFDGNFPIPASTKVGAAEHKLGLGVNSKLELYEYPGTFAHHYDGIDKGGGVQSLDGQLDQDPARIARVRMEEETVPGLVIHAQATCPKLVSGLTFTLAGHYSGNGDYLVTRIEHDINLGDTYYSGGGQAKDYTADLECIPRTVAFRPARVTPRPIIHGTQVATVVGSATDLKIFTDKFGRVKVTFPWDKNSANSCWVRLAMFWSDATWGTQFIPRGGQEVLVAYEEGDPDKPVIVGTAYNDKNLPPFALPDNASQSGIKTRGASTEKFHCLRFEDKKDNEEIWLRSEKDYKREVLNNETTIVGVDGKAKDGSQTITILKNRTVEVTKGDETFTIKEGSRTHKVHKDDTLTVETGNRTATIQKGNETLTIDKGNRSVTISAGNDSLSIDKGNRTVKLGAGAETVEAAKSITLKVGGCSIEITTSGITIKAPKIAIQGDGTVEVKSPATTVAGDGTLTLKGGMVKVN